MQVNRHRSTRNFVFLSVVFGIVSTILHYAGYGVADHIEQLPIILRSLDSTYLSNDFFVNAGASSIARHYYAELISTLAGSERNLPIVFLAITLCSNVLISVITFYLAQGLFEESSLAGIYASAIVMVVFTVQIAELPPTIFATSLIPETIARPLILGAILAVVRGRLVIGMLLSGVASIVHPLNGLEAGWLLLVAFVASQLASQRKLTTSWKAILLSLLILTGFSFVSIIPQFSQEGMDSNLFIYILAYFRHPHHYLPSTFGFTAYVFAASFFVAAFLAFNRWRQSRQESSSFILILGGMILLLCVGGYVFVEIVPSRIWATAQFFRLLGILKWLGLVFIAGEIAGMAEKHENSKEALYLVSVLHPLTVGVTAISQSLSAWSERRYDWSRWIFNPTVILLVDVALLLYLKVYFGTVLLLGFYIFAIRAFSTMPRRPLGALILIGVCLAVLGGIFYNRLPLPDRLKSVPDNLALKITASEIGPEGDEIAEFARLNTPEESIFLTPPAWGQFRLLARRAIVVDFKAFPFADRAILEWYERMTTNYGTPTLMGVAMIDELNRNYLNLNDSRLRMIREQYNPTYAVLYNETPTKYKVVFQNSMYKIVDLSQGSP